MKEITGLMATATIRDPRQRIVTSGIATGLDRGGGWGR
jgi:hypothetical protein